MQRFFDDFDSIHQFTRSLDYHQDRLTCTHCLKNDQWVSHGVVYKPEHRNQSSRTACKHCIGQAESLTDTGFLIVYSAVSLRFEMSAFAIGNLARKHISIESRELATVFHT